MYKLALVSDCEIVQILQVVGIAHFVGASAKWLHVKEFKNQQPVKYKSWFSPFFCKHYERWHYKFLTVALRKSGIWQKLCKLSWVCITSFLLDKRNKKHRKTVFGFYHHTIYRLKGTISDFFEYLFMSHHAHCGQQKATIWPDYSHPHLPQATVMTNSVFVYYLYFIFIYLYYLNGNFLLNVPLSPHIQPKLKYHRCDK